MNKNSKNNKLTIERILLRSETTRLRRDAQCLKHNERDIFPMTQPTHRVTLKIRNKRKERRTDTPNDSSGLKYVQITSNIEPTMTWIIPLENDHFLSTKQLTTKSNMLNDETKY